MDQVRTVRPRPGQTEVKGVIGFKYDYDHDPARIDPDTNRAVRTYDNGQFYLVYNKPRCRWQIVAVWRDTLRLVKTWETPEGDYLPISMKMFEWLKEGDLDIRFGTRDPVKVDRALRNLEQEREIRQEANIAHELADYQRYERHVLAHWHSKWQKKHAFDEGALYPNAGKKIFAP
jgi:hypothetical protein